MESMQEAESREKIYPSSNIYVTPLDLLDLQRMRHANRGRLLFRTPLWDLHVF